jgi:hypothetical protein
MSDNLPAVIRNMTAMSASGFEWGGDWYYTEYDKLYNNRHEVAVVYSPNYGGGLSSWYDYIDPTDYRIALLTLMGEEGTILWDEDGSEQEIRFANGRFYPYPESDMSNALAICWLPAGTLFRIDEYDGAESIETNHDVSWRIA